MHEQNCFHSYASDVMQAINTVQTSTQRHFCPWSCRVHFGEIQNNARTHVLERNSPVIISSISCHLIDNSPGISWESLGSGTSFHHISSISWESPAPINLMGRSHEVFDSGFSPLSYLASPKSQWIWEKLMNWGFRTAHVLISPHFVHLMRITSSHQSHGWIPWVPRSQDFLHYHTWHLQRASEFGETHEWGLSCLCVLRSYHHHISPHFVHLMSCM